MNKIFKYIIKDINIVEEKSLEKQDVSQHNDLKERENLLKNNKNIIEKKKINQKLPMENPSIKLKFTYQKSLNKLDNNDTKLNVKKKIQLN